MVHHHEPAQQVSVLFSLLLDRSPSLTLVSSSTSPSSPSSRSRPTPPPPLCATAKIVKDVTQLVLARRTRMCNFLEYKGAPFSPPPSFLPLASLTSHSTPVRRLKDRVPPLRELVLRVRHRRAGQRAHHARGHPPVRPPLSLSRSAVLEQR